MASLGASLYIVWELSEDGVPLRVTVVPLKLVILPIFTPLKLFLVNSNSPRVYRLEAGDVPEVKVVLPPCALPPNVSILVYFYMLNKLLSQY